MTQSVLFKSSEFSVSPALLQYGDESISVSQIAAVRLRNSVLSVWCVFKISAFTLLVCAAIVLPVLAAGKGPSGFGEAYSVLVLFALWLIGPIAALGAVVSGAMVAFQSYVRRGGYFLLVTASDGRVTQVNVPSASVGRAIKEAVEKAIAMHIGSGRS